MRNLLKRLWKDEDAFYMVEYVILTSMVVVCLIGTVEFVVVGQSGGFSSEHPEAEMGKGSGVKAKEEKIVGGALSPMYRFITTVMSLPVG